MSHSPQELAKAIAAAGQNGHRVAFGPASGFITNVNQLGAYRPLTRTMPPKQPVSRDIVADPIPEYLPAITEAPRASEGLTAPEVVHGVSVQLDIAVERRRSWFWRLALSMVVRRLR